MATLMAPSLPTLPWSTNKGLPSSDFEHVTGIIVSMSVKESKQPHVRKEMIRGKLQGKLRRYYQTARGEIISIAHGKPPPTADKAGQARRPSPNTSLVPPTSKELERAKERRKLARIRPVPWRLPWHLISRPKFWWPVGLKQGMAAKEEMGLALSGVDVYRGTFLIQTAPVTHTVCMCWIRYGRLLGSYPIAFCRILSCFFFSPCLGGFLLFSSFLAPSSPSGVCNVSRLLAKKTHAQPAC